MVNGLLTNFIKHNLPLICRVAVEQGTDDEEANSWFLGLAAWWRLGQLEAPKIEYQRARSSGPFSLVKTTS
jgi:hypothetical protein